MTICVIGGAGFIGRQLVSMLVDSGRNVQVVGRSRDLAHALPKGALYTSCDSNDHEMLKKILSDATEIIDLSYATVPKTSFDNPLYDLQANLTPSVKLFDMARNISKLKKLLIVSSGGTVYGNTSKSPTQEDAPTNPISPYGITKLAIERYAQMYQTMFDVPTLVLRPANAYGIGQRLATGQGFIAAAIAAATNNSKVSIYGARGTVRDYIHVKDIAAGILASLDLGAPGETFNIGTGVGHDNLQVLDLIRPLAQLAGNDFGVEILPTRKFDVPENILCSQKLSLKTGWKSTINLKDGIEEVWHYSALHY